MKKTSGFITTRNIAAALVCGISVPAFSADGPKITFEDHVLPIFQNSCLNCHNPDKKKGDLDASSFNGLMAGGGSGKVVLPDDADGSLLWKLINHLEDPKMPPKAAKLGDAELGTIKKWIAGGLLENSGAKAIVSKKPKMDFSLKTVASGKPEGPPPMPNGDLLLEPPVVAPRAGAIPAIAASPWAPLVAVAGQRQVLLYNADTLAIEGVLPFPEGYPVRSEIQPKRAIAPGRRRHRREARQSRGLQCHHRQADRGGRQ